VKRACKEDGEDKRPERVFRGDLVKEITRRFPVRRYVRAVNHGWISRLVFLDEWRVSP
jgi:hypothetical protein